MAGEQVDRPTLAGVKRSGVVASERDDTSVGAGDAIQRCVRCGHPIWSETSVRLELGPVCRRLQVELEVA